jgi:hypothetical protein
MPPVPTGNRRLGHAEPLGEFSLEQAEIKPPFAEVISYCDKDLRIDRGEGPRTFEGEMAKRATRGCGSAVASSMNRAGRLPPGGAAPTGRGTLPDEIAPCQCGGPTLAPSQVEADRSSTGHVQGCRVSAPPCRKKALVAISVTEHRTADGGRACLRLQAAGPSVAVPLHEPNDDRTRMANGP